jgi:putative peptidoglycan lipid II flippase
MKDLLSGATILSLGTIASYILGAIRDIFFARAYGASVLTDAYFKAFLLSDSLLLICISSALLGLATPLFLREYEKNRQEALRTFGNFFFTLNAFFCFIIIISQIFLPQILSVLFSGVNSDIRDDFIMLARIFLLSNLFFSLSNFIGTFSLSFGRFVSTAFAPLFYNIGILFGILFFADSFGIFAAAYGALFGSLLHFFSRLIEYFSFKERFVLSFSWNDPILKELLSSMFIKALAISMVPLVLYFFANFSEEASGIYTLFLYTRNLESAPVAIFGIAIATASFQRLSGFSSRFEWQSFSKTFWASLEKILFWTIPSMVGMFFFGTFFIQMLYDISSSEVLFSLVICMAFAIPFEALMHLFSRSFHAIQNASIPLFANALFVVGTVCFAFILKDPKWIGGAYAGGYILQTIFYLFLLPKLPLSLPPKKYWKNFLGILFLSAGMIGILIGIGNFFSEIHYFVFGVGLSSIFFFFGVFVFQKKLGLWEDFSLFSRLR